MNVLGHLWLDLGDATKARLATAVADAIRAEQHTSGQARLGMIPHLDFEAVLIMWAMDGSPRGSRSVDVASPWPYLVRLGGPDVIATAADAVMEALSWSLGTRGN